MTAGYALDAVGLPINLLAVAAAALAGAAIAVTRSRPVLAPVPVVAAVFGYAMWLASPAFLPVTNGPDVVHHLQLIHFIARSGRLPHDPATARFLAEMRGYTPGSHLLAAAVGGWLRLDPLRVVYPLAALFVAVTAGIVFELARRFAPPGMRGWLAALSAPLLALVPAAYFVGALVDFFYFAQIVSEAFAAGALLFALLWLDDGRRRDLMIVSLCAVGVVLAWPVWIGPVAGTVFVVLLLRPASWRARAGALALMLGPAAIVMVVHQWRNPGAAHIVSASGAVTPPSVAVLGAGFLVLVLLGTLLALRTRRGLLVLTFLAVTVLQGGALAVVSARAGSSSYYMAFKMAYLAVVPAAVLAAMPLIRAAEWMTARAPRAAVLAAGIPLLVAALLVRGRIPVRPLRGSLSLAANDVGVWAREHVPPACVDYFSRYWLTGYWLHLDVLGNPRSSDRMAHETFDFPDVAARWIEGRGLPYAIVEDMTALPHEIRPDMEPLYQRGSFVLVRNRRAAACPY